MHTKANAWGANNTRHWHTSKITFTEYKFIATSKTKATKTLLGKDTSSAIIAGIIYSTAYAAIGVINELEKKYKTKAEVFLTGGNATIIKNIVQKEIPLLLEPNLVIKGVQKYAEENTLSIK